MYYFLYLYFQYICSFELQNNVLRYQTNQTEVLKLYYSRFIEIQQTAE